VVHVRVPKSSRAVEMTVTLQDGRLEVRSSQQREGEAALAGELLHPVVEDEDGDGDVDWELTDWPSSAPLADTSRRVTVSLRKAREALAYSCMREGRRSRWIVPRDGLRSFSCRWSARLIPVPQQGVG
jgi:hypothetical protein